MHIITANFVPLAAASLWARVRAAYARAVAAVGAPAAIAALGLLSRALRCTIAARIALIEHLVRKLLLAEAGRLAQSPRRWNSGRAHTRIRLGARTSSRAFHAAPRDLARPETWPARFALAPPRDPRAVPEASAPRIRVLWDASPIARAQPVPPPAPRAEDAAFRLARRLEALRRVLDDPLTHAERLARLLLRLRRRHPEVVVRFAMAPARTSTFDRDDPGLGVEAVASGLTGANAFTDSS